MVTEGDNYKLCFCITCI